jgi:chorismate dehydratase
MKGHSFRFGVFPYLVARPLIYGLDGVDYLDLLRVPPSRLKRLLAGGDVDVALMPTVDLPAFGKRLTVLTAGCLAGAGPTLMAKIYSQTSPEQMNVLWADSNSHSFLVLVQALWMSRYRRRLSVVPFDSSAGRAPPDAQAVLLIGDRVVTDPPLGFERHFDPVAMWHEMTGLPFVAKIWATTRQNHVDELYEMLTGARQRGQENLAAIARDFGPAYGWPGDLALRCLTREVQYSFTEAHREGLEEFLDLAAQQGLTGPGEPLQYYKP